MCEDKRQSFGQDFEDLVVAWASDACEADGIAIPDGAGPLVKSLILGAIKKTIGDLPQILPQFTDTTFDQIVVRIGSKRSECYAIEMLAQQLEVWQSRVSRLNENLISTVEEISAEYMIWLKTQPGHLTQIHWHAFEQIVGEIMSSHGFEVQLTGRVRGRSADIMAIKADALGVTTKYLVECKHYKRNIGLSIVNGVVGSRAINDVDHALLVTTGRFTRDVMKRKAKLEEKRLHLRDGEKIREWLAAYEENENGLWLPEGWDLDVN